MQPFNLWSLLSRYHTVDRSFFKMTKAYMMNSFVEKVKLNRLTFSQYQLISLPWFQMQSPDQDFRWIQMMFHSWCFHQLTINDRFMGLNDLMTEIKQDPASFQGDEPVENKVLNTVLSLVEDKISEVKNQAVKWYVWSWFFVVGCRSWPSDSLGQLIKILRQTQMELVVDKLIEFSGGQDEELRDISGLGSCLITI